MMVINALSNIVSEAIEALARGSFLLIHDSDSRENETDMVVAAEFVTPETIKRMRTEAGGLVCLAIHPRLAAKLGLPFMDDILSGAGRISSILPKLAKKENPYGGSSAFSITINHKDTYTGINDWDRALTITELTRLCKNGTNPKEMQTSFASNFRSPGHVHLLIAADGLLANRRGHTELSIFLAELANKLPMTVICELLDGHTYRSLSVHEAKRLARVNGMPFLEGSELVRNKNALT